jgi:hypothetical protein
LAALWECIPERQLIHKAFFEIAVAAHTKFKDADAIANAIGCALFTAPGGAVPDGGATVMLLGAALGTLGVARRYITT